MQREVQSWRQTEIQLETELGTDRQTDRERQRNIETEGEGELWVQVETRRERQTDRDSDKPGSELHDHAVNETLAQSGMRCTRTSGLHTEVQIFRLDSEQHNEMQRNLRSAH